MLHQFKKMDIKYQNEYTLRPINILAREAETMILTVTLTLTLK